MKYFWEVGPKHPWHPEYEPPAGVEWTLTRGFHDIWVSNGGTVLVANNIVECSPYVYMWTNDDIDKMYIGATSGKMGYTYAGSGIEHKKAIAEYPITFKRTILKHFETPEEAFEYEEYLLRKIRKGGLQESFYNISLPKLRLSKKKRARKEKKKSKNVNTAMVCPVCGSLAKRISTTKYHCSNCGD